ncbi:dTMP kinase [Magnetovirga frankeli]|uniref:dTMP kinase n=1 Tax=Magnetovirga frankeli TaxID=947516 RepID=UPI001293AED1|nr:dTMP kinase [gamma proteobacterium SS-5]
MSGRFITIEGIEGAGKSTCMAFLRQYIERQGLAVVETREPGGTPLGEDLRALLLGHKHQGMSAKAELLLMFAARAEHLQQRIKPALARGDWVLCDRFTDATYAYQGAGRTLSAKRVEQIEDWVQGPLRPDLTLLLDIPVELGLERAGKRSTPDRFEAESLAFFRAVRQAYLDIAAAQPERVKRVDASLSLGEVQGQLAELIDALLDSPK